MRQPTERFVILTPRNESARAKLSYHGDRWTVRGSQAGLRFGTDKTEHLRVMSRDGSKLILVRLTDDPDYDVRALG